MTPNPKPDSTVEDLKEFKISASLFKRLYLGTKVRIKDWAGSEDAFGYVVGYSFYEVAKNQFYGFVTIVDEQGILYPSMWGSLIKKVEKHLSFEEMLTIPGVSKVLAFWIKCLKEDSVPSSQLLHFIHGTKKEWNQLKKQAKRNNMGKKEQRLYAPPELENITIKKIKARLKSKKDKENWHSFKTSLTKSWKIPIEILS